MEDNLDDLLAGVTGCNIHPETNTGDAVGNEMLADDLNQRRARFVYEAARLAAIAAEAPIVPAPYDEREQDFRDQLTSAIEVMCGPNRAKDPETVHEIWVRAYNANGWSYGEMYDRDARTHPDLVPFNELNQREQDKDSVYIALCEIARQWIRE